MVREVEVNDISTVGAMQSWWQYVKGFSFFVTRFGVYIHDSTVYVANFSVFATFICVASLVGVIVVYGEQLGMISNCCNFSMVYFKNITDPALKPLNL